MALQEKHALAIQYAFLYGARGRAVQVFPGVLTQQFKAFDLLDARTADNADAGRRSAHDCSPSAARASSGGALSRCRVRVGKATSAP